MGLSNAFLFMYLKQQRGSFSEIAPTVPTSVKRTQLLTGVATGWDAARLPHPSPPHLPLPLAPEYQTNGLKTFFCATRRRRYGQAILILRGLSPLSWCGGVPEPRYLRQGIIDGRNCAFTDSVIVSHLHSELRSHTSNK